MATSRSGKSVQICEVGPRDGLQNFPKTLPVEVRTELVNRLARCGVDRIEVGSFVSRSAVPQMADTELVVKAIDRVRGVIYAGLVLNHRGAERAIESGLNELHFAFAVTDTFNHRNQGATVQASIDVFATVAKLARSAGSRITCTIGASFGCPFEGAVTPRRVTDVAVELASRGAEEIVLADTIGVAVPVQVETLFAQVREAIGPSIPLGGHFHDTRSTGLANADAALRSGASLLDASIGGLGGCPFAPNASGNIATEDLGYLLRQSEVETRLDLLKLVDTGRWLQEHIDQPVPGTIVRAGLFPECVQTIPIAAKAKAF